MEFSVIVIAQMIITFIITCALVYMVRLYARKRLMDNPGERSSHTVPTPRGGGIAFVIVQMGLVSIFALLDPVLDPKSYVPTIPVSVFYVAGGLALLGWLDDLYNLTPKRRLLYQVLGAVVAVGLLKHFCRQYYPILPDWPTIGIFSYPICIFILVWSTNLFNFMDGLDGLAASEAVFFLGLSAYFIMPQSSAMAVLCLLFCVSVLAFLAWNWPPAKIFMGDVGSSYLGFLLALITLIAAMHYQMSMVPFFIMYSVFWIDTTVTLIRRFLKRENWTEGHKSHAYQRLHQAGWSHDKIVCSVMALNAMLGIFALTAYHQPSIAWRLLLLSVMLILLAYALVERIYPMYPRRVANASFQ